MLDFEKFFSLDPCDQGRGRSPHMRVTAAQTQVTSDCAAYATRNQGRGRSTQAARRICESLWDGERPLVTSRQDP